jgi:hypothetical protein
LTRSAHDGAGRTRIAIGGHTDPDVASRPLKAAATGAEPRPALRSPSSMPESFAAPVGDWAADLSRCRRRALDEVTAELGPTHRRTDQPAVSVRDYGPGCFCLGVAGPVDRAMAERLQVLLGELRVRGRRELVITLHGVGSWHPQLARVLAHARVQHLVDGGRVELHDLPEGMAAVLGPGLLPTEFLVEDDAVAAPATVPAATRTPPVRPRPPRPPSGPHHTPGQDSAMIVLDLANLAADAVVAVTITITIARATLDTRLYLDEPGTPANGVKSTANGPTGPTAPCVG